MKSTWENIAMVDNCLDDLGKDLLNILEENWEITQATNELRELKAQNDATLKLKVSELQKAVGDVELYNKIEAEIASLKEVMNNNEKIEKEVEANLQTSNEEKKLVQSKILDLISQNVKNPQSPSNSTRSPQIEKSLKLLGIDSEALDFVAHRESEVVERQNKAKDDKIHELEWELQKMKRELAEKVNIFFHTFSAF